MAEILPNNGLQSSLAGAILSTDTTLTIQSGDAAKWPTGGEYRAVLCADAVNGPWELVKVTGGQGTATLTVSRAAEAYNGDSTAKAWASGTSVSAVLTHDSLQALIGAAGGTSDVFSPADNSLEQRNGTNPQSWYIYNTYTDASNYERGFFRWQFGIFETGTEYSGTGQPHAVRINANGGANIIFGTNFTDRWYISGGTSLYAPTGSLLPSVDGAWDIGGQDSGGSSKRPRDLVLQRNLDVSGNAEIDGPLGLGGGPVGYSGIYLTTWLQGSGTVQYGMYLQPGYGTDVRSAWQIYSYFDFYQSGASVTDGGTLWIYYPYVRSPITNMYGIYIQNQGDGNETNLYGIYIQNQTGATTINYGLYNAGLTVLDNHLRWNTDGIYDIGAGGANRPANIYAANNVVASQANVNYVAWPSNAPDTFLTRDAANRLALRNGTTAQTFMIYGTYTDASNYERLTLDYFGGVYRVTSNALGTGTQRSLTILGGGGLTLSGSSGTVTFSAGGSARWVLSTSGHLTASTDNAPDIGASGATRPRNVFVAGALATGTKAGVPVDGDVSNPTDGMLRVDTTGNAFYFRSGGTWRAAGGGLTIPLGQSLTFNPDNTYDIGASNATRPRDTYLARNFIIGTTTTAGNIQFQHSSGGTAIGQFATYTLANGAITIGGTNTGDINLATSSGAPSTRWTIQNAGHLIAATDNVYDIGASGATRPRNLYIAGNASIAGTVAAGATTLSGNLYFSANNTYDIGDLASNNRPRDVYVGRNLIVAGSGEFNRYGAGSNVAIGSPPGTWAGLNITPFFSGGGPYYSIYNSPAFTSNIGPSAGYGAYFTLATSGSVFTMPTGYNVYVAAPNAYTGSSITTVYGLYIENQGKAGITNAYGLYIAAHSGAATTNLSLWNAGNSQFDGLVGVGGGPVVGYAVYVRGALTGSAFQIGVYSSPTIDSTATSWGAGMYAKVSTAAAAFTQGTTMTIAVATPTVGSGSAITTAYGLYVYSQAVAGVVNAYGINIAPMLGGGPTNQYALYIGQVSGGSSTNLGLYSLAPTWLTNTISVGWQGPNPSIAVNVVYSFANGVGSPQIAQKFVPAFSADCTSGQGMYFQPTANNSAVMSQVEAIRLDTPNFGTATCTTYYGLHVNNQGRALTTTSYGIYIDAQSGSSNQNVGLYNSSVTDLAELATPATPAAGALRVYAKSDHYLYTKDSTGVERAVGIDKALRTYVQKIMATIDPGGAPAPPP